MSPDPTMAPAGHDDAELDALVAAMTNSDRVGVLNALCMRPGMASAEIAERTGLSPQTVRKHLRALMETGIVEVKERRANRGVQQLYFVLRRYGWIKQDEDSQLSARQRREIDLGILRSTLQDARQALAAPGYGARPGRMAAHVPATVDAQAWAEISDLQHELLGRLLEIVDEGNRRLGESGGEPITITTALLLLELPGEPADEDGEPPIS